jgi:Uma2 family endonuclease
MLAFRAIREIMNIALRKSMTLEQFLDWEIRQELRYEFDGVQPVAMNGVRVEHAIIESNLALALGNRLKGKPCRAFGSNLKIEVAGRIRYPDAFVVCTPIPPGAYVVRDPVVVFEILSPTTSHTDLVLKTAEYHATPSILRYVILEQTHAGAQVFSRRGADWIAETVKDDDVLRLPEIGIEIPLPEIYADVALEPDADEPPP